MAYRKQDMFEMKQDFLKFLDERSGSKIKFKCKEDSTFMKILDKVTFWNPRFMKATMIVGNTIYLSRRLCNILNDDTGVFTAVAYGDLIGTLAHEFSHWIDKKALIIPGLFLFLYFCPQVLGVLCASLAVWSPWMLIPAATLLAPAPAPYRAYTELKGFKTDVCLNYWLWNSKSYKRYVDVFSDINYWFMWPFKSYIENSFKKHLDNLSQNATIRLSNWQKEIHSRYFDGD